MVIENLSSKPIGNSSEKKEKVSEQSLDDFLQDLQQEGITTLPAKMIKKQLEDTGVAVVTRSYNCGIRISREGSRFRGDYKYRTWTTNELEDPDHPLSKKFARKNITIN